MYARQVKDQTLTLAVSGLLWNHSLIMIDEETETLWNQLLGQAKRGPLEGHKLRQLPSMMTDWQTWRQLHPDTTVMALSRTTTAYNRRFYRRIAFFLVGVADGPDAKAWAFARLMKEPVVNDQFKQAPLVILFEPVSKTANIYNRRLGKRTLTFELRGEKLIDRQTQSEWDLRSGKALSGPLEGSALKPALSIVSLRRSWKIFHPKSEYWEIDHQSRR